MRQAADAPIFKQLLVASFLMLRCGTLVQVFTADSFLIRNPAEFKNNSFKSPTNLERSCNFFNLIRTYGGFHKWGYPPDGLSEKIPLELMIWGYPRFRNPPIFEPFPSNSEVRSGCSPSFGLSVRTCWRGVNLGGLDLWILRREKLAGA